MSKSDFGPHLGSLNGMSGKSGERKKVLAKKKKGFPAHSAKLGKKVLAGDELRQVAQKKIA